MCVNPFTPELLSTFKISNINPLSTVPRYSAFVPRWCYVKTVTSVCVCVCAALFLILNSYLTDSNPNTIQRSGFLFEKNRILLTHNNRRTVKCTVLFFSVWTHVPIYICIYTHTYTYVRGICMHKSRNDRIKWLKKEIKIYKYHALTNMTCEINASINTSIRVVMWHKLYTVLF